MKCPYRKITETKHQYNADVTTEEFCECYGRECPFYDFSVIKDKDICWKAVEDGGEEQNEKVGSCRRIR